MYLYLWLKITAEKKAVLLLFVLYCAYQVANKTPPRLELKENYRKMPGSVPTVPLRKPVTVGDRTYVRLEVPPLFGWGFTAGTRHKHKKRLHTYILKLYW